MRRIIGLGLLALILGGCSMVRLTYDQAPNLMYWWIDGYVDVSGEQTPRLRDALDRWFAWHRRTQLPDYAALLARAQREVIEPTTAAALCSWSAEIEKRIDGSLEEAVPAAAQLMLSLSPEQLQHIERRMAKGMDEARAEFLQADRAERERKSLERAVERFENLYGRLDASQREQLAGLLLKSSFDPERWLAERRIRQRDMLRSLATVNALGRANLDRNAALQQARLAARSIATHFLRSPRADYRAYQQRLLQENCQVIATMHNSMTAAQRQAARARLKGWEDDLRSLVAGAANGNDVLSR